MYQWRELSAEERAELLTARQRAKRPWHSPPHWKQEGPAWFHLTAACYEHAPVIGVAPSRMDGFAIALLAASQPAAWCLLPNHYHVLIETSNLGALTRALGKLHGRSSRAWNLEDTSIGRQVFHRAADRHVRSEAHFWATLNYIHHNPVRHGYVKRWTDWPWSSARDYLDAVGREEAMRTWRNYPILDYGEGWDAPHV
jgi:putative transposase